MRRVAAIGGVSPGARCQKRRISEIPRPYGSGEMIAMLRTQRKTANAAVFPNPIRCFI